MCAAGVAVQTCTCTGVVEIVEHVGPPTHSARTRVCARSVNQDSEGRDDREG